MTDAATIARDNARLKLQARIEAASIPVTECGCWIWLRCERIKGRGYGNININAKSVNAHRASWIAYKGPVPDNLHVLHHCDTPACVNPDHLFLGTNRDNMADKKSKGRGANLSGQSNPRAKLNRSQVLEIRSSTERSGLLAAKFNVNRHHIALIRSGKSWVGTL